MHTTSVSSAACYDAYGSVFWLPGQRVHASLSVQLPTGQHTVVCKLVAVWRDATRCCEVFYTEIRFSARMYAGKIFVRHVLKITNMHISPVCVCSAWPTQDAHWSSITGMPESVILPQRPPGLSQSRHSAPSGFLLLTRHIHMAQAPSLFGSGGRSIRDPHPPFTGLANRTQKCNADHFQTPGRCFGLLMPHEE